MISNFQSFRKIRGESRLEVPGYAIPMRAGPCLFFDVEPLSRVPGMHAHRGVHALVERGETSIEKARRVVNFNSGAARSTARWLRRDGAPERVALAGLRGAVYTRDSNAKPRVSNRPVGAE